MQRGRIVYLFVRFVKVEMIRTYSRKPQECRYIEGVMGLCRLCLGTAEDAVPIFTEDPGNICSTLAMRIMICVGLDVKRDDNLPNLVCESCFKELEHYYAFRKRCEVTYQRLKSHLLATRSRPPVEAITEENEILKDIVISQEENENVNNFGVIMEECVVNKVPETTAPSFMIGDVHSVNPVNTEAPQQELRSMQPEELSTLITSVLVKLGVLSRRGPCLAVQRTDVSRLQLEAGGAVLRMDLVEEDCEEEDEITAPKEELFVEETETCVPMESKPSLVEEKPSIVQHKAIFVEPKKKTPKIHTNAGAAACPQCGRVLASRSALRRHARTHSGERPYCCPTCARAFAQKEVLHRHMLVHEAVRPHKCSTCDKSFTQRNALELHARSHLPPHERALALHTCPHCPKLFLYSSGLSRHMMTHSGRVYVCGACRRQFADKSSVLRHHRARHAELQDPGLADSAQPVTEDEGL